MQNKKPSMGGVWTFYGTAPYKTDVPLILNGQLNLRPAAIKSFFAI